MVSVRNMSDGGYIAPSSITRLDRYEQVNGENYIDLETSAELNRGDLLGVTSGIDNIERVYYVWSSSMSHSGDVVPCTYRCVWALQGILSTVTCTAMPSNKTARQALSSLLADTDAFTIGTVEPAATASASFWRMSAWEGLGVLLDTWGGEVDVDGWTVNLLNRIGNPDSFKLFWGSSDIESIERRMADGPEVCRIIPLGAANETDSGGHGRKIDISSVNSGRLYLEDSAKAAEMAGSKQPTATLYVENPEIDSPAALKAWGQSVLEQYTQPSPEFDVRLVERYARTPGYVPSLGDSGTIIDADAGWEMAARVVAITVDELAQSVKAELSATVPGKGALASLVSGNQTLGGVDTNGFVNVAGRASLPLYIYGSLPANADVPLLPCFVYVTGTKGLYYFD